MTPPVRNLLRFWFVAPLLAVLVLFWMHRTRAQRVELVSTPAAPVAVDPKSPTGYAGGVRMLIAPGHNNESYQWILQTQQMVAQGEWRLRRVDYDNAPTGRPVHSPSPYRWWLAAVGWGLHLFTGQPLGLAIEQAALWADPLLHGILVLLATGFVAWRFGRLPALLLSLALVFSFPLAGGFVPGAPDARNLKHVLFFVSLMALLAGIFTPASSAPSTRRWFIAAGILGALALWVDVNVALLLASIGVGGLTAAWLSRRQPKHPNLPWRAWGLAGAVTTLAAYLIEYAPAHLDLRGLRLTTLHPLYAVAWWGGGELLARLPALFRREKQPRRSHILSAIAALAMISLPATMWLKSDAGFLAEHTFSDRLALLDETPAADNFAKGLVQGGIGLPLAAAAIPLLLLGPAIWLLLSRQTAPQRRAALALLLVPVAVSFAFACAQLSWWSTLHYLLAATLVLVAAGETTPERRAFVWLGSGIAAFLPGLIALLPPRLDAANPEFTPIELQGLAERDFAHWLAKRRGEENAIVLAPPNLTVSLIYHGGLRGLGTPYRENEDGFRAAVRIAGAIHADEAHALARQRGLTHIVIPSWDAFLDEYARLGGAQIEQTFLGLLHAWLPPRWLRPVAYYVPNRGSFEQEQLFVFEQTDIQDNATSLSRLAEYFLDMGQMQLAGMLSQTLAHEFGADLGAQIAKARTDIARRDRAAFGQTIETISASLQEGVDDLLPWDRRVSLCLVLATANRMEVAREQVERCLYEISDADVRTLSEGTLFRFLVLCKTLELEIEDPQLRELARSLIPAALREQL